MDGSLPGSSVHGILQARILEWVAMPSSRGSSWPRDRAHICSSCITSRFLLLSHQGCPDKFGGHIVQFMIPREMPSLPFLNPNQMKCSPVVSSFHHSNVMTKESQLFPWTPIRAFSEDDILDAFELPLYFSLRPTWAQIGNRAHLLLPSFLCLI